MSELFVRATRALDDLAIVLDGMRLPDARTEWLHTRVTQYQHDALMNLSKRRGISASELVREQLFGGEDA